jgi:hypothetical protein
MRASLPQVAGLLCLLVVACATATPGAQPGDMSAPAHEQQAGEHALAGEQHAGEYRRDAGVERLRCSPSGGRPGPNGSAVLAEPICWTSVENPTATRLDEAEKHHRAAADHRAASVALRQAEARACGGISEADRDMSPFDHR